MIGTKPKKCSECGYFAEDFCTKRNELRVGEDNPCNKSRLNPIEALINGGMRHERPDNGNRIQ